MSIELSDYDRGKRDGYDGDQPPEGQSKEYWDGYRSGQADWAEQVAASEQDRVEEDPAYWAHYGFDPVEQGMYDDDPNPYHGDYSEM